MANEEKNIIAQADFHPILKTYLFVNALFFLLISVAGIILIPFWLLGFGQMFTKRYFDNLKCILTSRTLEFRKGYMFKVEKTIPLDKIQDLTLREGPLLRLFNICILSIETAGQSNPQGTSDAKLIGIKEAREFRKKVLEQRDKINEREESRHAEREKDDSQNILVEMRDSLHRIEKLLEK